MGELLRGWRILGLMSGVLAAVLVAQGTSADDLSTFLLQSIRWTARLAFPCFWLAWVASSLHVLTSTEFSRRLVANRRYLTVTFAVLHLVHLGFIAALAVASSGASLAGRTWIELGGVIAYVFVVTILLTSFAPFADMMSPSARCTLHRVGGYWIAVVFSVSYGGRAAESWMFMPQASALVLGFALRFITRKRRPTP